MIFKAIVKYIGEEVETFFNNDNFFIFYEDIPDPIIRENCVIISIEEYNHDITDNSTLYFDNQEFTILAVGKEVNTTLKQLSHATLRFGDNTEILLGSIYLKEIPTQLPSIGSQIIIK